MDSKTKWNINPFDGERYRIWKYRIRSLLSDLNVIKVIDSDALTPLNKEWMKAESTAKTLIIDYLSDSLLGVIGGNLSAREIFKNLDSIYERKSLATQLAVRKKLLNLKLHGDMAMTKHFTIFDNLITELMAAGAKMDEMDKVAHLLLTMPSTYDCYSYRDTN